MKKIIFLFRYLYAIILCLFDNPNNWEEFKEYYPPRLWEKLTQRQQWEIECRKIVKTDLQ